MDPITGFISFMVLWSSAGVAMIGAAYDESQLTPAERRLEWAIQQNQNLESSIKIKVDEHNSLIERMKNSQEQFLLARQEYLKRLQQLNQEKK